jgi:hypothetical protein
MPTRQLPLVPLYTPVFMIILIAMFCNHANSTSVAVLESKQGFIILADSKQTHNGADKAFCRGNDTNKLFILRERFAIAAIGTSCMYGVYQDRSGGTSKIAYNIDTAWVEELQNSLPKDVSMKQVVISAEAKFSSVVPDIQKAVTANAIYPSDSMNRLETFITFVIVGYDAGLPTVGYFRFYIDWDKQSVIEALPGGVDLRPIDGTDMAFYVFGMAEAVADISNPKSYAYGQAMAACPKAFGDFISRRSVSLDESISIGRVLIKIEEKVNPSKVGGEITGVQILANGTAMELPDVGPLPKTVTGQARKRK